ncbi:MAG: peptidase, partial [Desulfovibrio sp.]|nr:peptidase [Desulfovibrio sp.]
ATLLFCLASGEQLTAVIRRSARARRASLRLAPDGHLSLTLPVHWPANALRDCHDRFLPWLERAWGKQR